MTIRILATALLAASTALLVSTPAGAIVVDYTGKDPYKTGCARSARAIRTGDLLTYVNKEDVGDVTLMWSRTCKAAWGVIKVSPEATGAILLATDLKEKGKTSYRRYTAGKGGRHWGPMLAVASGRCVYAWAEATTGPTVKDSGHGKTAMACR